MKRTKIKKLVLTDGTWYYANTSGTYSHFTDNSRKAWNFYCERFPEINKKKDLDWQVDVWTKHEPLLTSTNQYGKDITVEDNNFNRENFRLKWITIIETIKEEDFNYEGFAGT